MISLCFFCPANSTYFALQFEMAEGDLIFDLNVNMMVHLVLEKYTSGEELVSV